MEKPLSEANPIWIDHRNQHVGIMFRCPIKDCKCKNVHMTFFWSHPSRPKRPVTGDTFETLSFETKLDARRYGCTFYGELKNGILSWEEK